MICAVANDLMSTKLTSLSSIFQPEYSPGKSTQIKAARRQDRSCGDFLTSACHFLALLQDVVSGVRGVSTYA